MNRSAQPAAHGSFEELEMEFIAEEEGYVMAYTSNQTNENLNVFMDDMLLTHTTGPIVRVDDYYPFGLTFNSSALDNKLTNKYLYQGKELLQETGNYDFEWRSYDPIIGRTWQIDPHAENYYDLSTFSWTGNNPILNIDPSGMDWYSNDETGALIWHDPEKNDDGTTNAYLKGHTYLAGANANFDDIRNTYEFVNGNNTFGGNNLMTFLDHASKNSSEKEMMNVLSQIAGIAFGDENGEGNIKPTGFTAKYMEMADGSTLLSAISGASAGMLERGKGFWLNTAEGLNKVRDIFAEFDISFSNDSKKVTAKTLLDQKEYGVDSMNYLNVLLIVDYENDSLTRVTPNPMGPNVTGWYSKSTKGKWVNETFKAP